MMRQSEVHAMKGCYEYGATIQLYLDNELSDPDLKAFRVHLERCAACGI